MDFNMNDFMFQIQAVLDVDINKLKRQLEGSMRELQNTIDIDSKISLDIQGATESINSVTSVLDKLNQAIDAIQGNYYSVKLKFDDKAFTVENEKFKKQLDVIYKENGVETPITKDATTLLDKYTKVKGIIDHISKTKLSSTVQKFVDGQVEDVFNDDGSKMTLFDKLANSDSNFRSVLLALQEVEKALEDGVIDAERLDSALRNFKKLNLASSEADEMFALNNVASSHNSSVQKSEQTALYKHRKMLMQEEEALNKRLISLNNTKNKSEIENIRQTIILLKEKRREIEDEIASKNLTGAFFEQDIKNYDEKAKQNISQKLSKESDAQDKAIQKNILALEQLLQATEAQRDTSVQMSAQERAAIEQTTVAIRKQIQALQEAKNAKITGNTSNEDSYVDELLAVQNKGQQNALAQEMLTNASAFIKMQKDADSVIHKTKEMEEALRKAFSQYGNIDKSKLDMALASTLKTRQEAEKLKAVNLGDFNAANATGKMNGLNASIKEVKLSMTEAVNEAQRWDRSFGQIFDVGKLIAFTSQFSYLRGALTSITREVKNVDAAMTTLKITMNGTEKTFKSMLEQSKKLAKETGSTYTGALEVLSTYANSSEDIASVLDKIKPSMILSNISSLGVSDAVDSIQAISAQFQLIEEASGDAEEASYRVVDALTSISKTLKMDFGKGISEMSDAIKASGSVMSDAGLEMEKYAAQVAVVIEQSRLAGSQRLPIYRNINIKTS